LAYARNTWRHLRLAMVGVLLGLAASVFIELFKVKFGCYQTSLSAYFYTPVHEAFVGALLTLGVCLICLRGSTDIEDLLLNVAGMLALIVAFVPTQRYDLMCTSAPLPKGQVAANMTTANLTTANVTNDVVALLIIGGIALLFAGGVLVSSRTTRPARIGCLVGIVLWIVTCVIYVVCRPTFFAHAHDWAARLMFVCIIGAAIDNARDTPRPRYRGLYTALAIGMPAVALGILAVGRITPWDHKTIWLETAVLVLFATFWVIQTVDLWNGGIRPRSQGRSQPSQIRPALWSPAKN
jgi:hypothetical protein